MLLTGSTFPTQNKHKSPQKMHSGEVIRGEVKYLRPLLNYFLCIFDGILILSIFKCKQLSIAVSDNKQIQKF